MRSNSMRSKTRRRVFCDLAPSSQSQPFVVAVIIGALDNLGFKQASQLS